MTLYDPAFHGARVWQTGIEPGIFCRCELSRTMTLRGYPDTGLAMVQEAVAAAGALDHPQPRAFALLFEMFVHLARRTPRDVQRAYEQLAVVCHAHGIAQEMYWAAPLVGRALIEMGDLNRGLRVLEEGLAAHTLSRSALIRPYYLVLLAGAQLRAGRFDRAQASLDESTRVADATGQHAYRRRTLAAAGRSLRRHRRGRRRRAEVSRGARDLHDGKVRGGSSSAPRAATRITLSRTAAPPKPATSCSPSCRGSSKAATRWTTCMRRGCSGRWTERWAQGSELVNESSFIADAH